MNATIGVDVGATTISGGLVTGAGEILHDIQLPTRQPGPGTVGERLLGVIEELADVGSRRGVVVDGVGVGVAGAIDPETGEMRPYVGNGLPELAHVPLARDIRQVTGLPAFVDNDANALALAEWTFGVGRGARSLALFALGTAVGGGVIIGDALVRGHQGYAAEFHGLPINFDGPPTPIGRGCLGEYVGGAALAAHAREQLDAGCCSALAELAGRDRSRITSELVFRAARQGDPLAKTIVDRLCEALAAGIGIIVGTFNPEVVVVTGGVARSLVSLEDDVRRRAAAYAIPPALAGTRIHVVPGDKRQTVRGGAALVRYELERGRLAGRV